MHLTNFDRGRVRYQTSIGRANGIIGNDRPTGDSFSGGQKDPFWSWTHIHSHDVQDNHITIAQQVAQVTGNGVHRTRVNDPEIYELYYSVNALHRYEPPQ